MSKEQRETRRRARNRTFLVWAKQGVPRWRAWVASSLLHRRWGNR